MMSKSTYENLEKRHAFALQEIQSLKNKLKRRDKKIRELQKSGPDADLIKANIALVDEVNELKEKLGIPIREGTRK